ncbi:aminodeoxychorismate synthase component I [Leeia sp. TBRC 13508]|uniref:Aminodeoxychorismate synthase component I n=1 Tax=Leeia speluncae TaxID=2884804 RepID=A0ABS8D8V3_9NEIS|nr:aminodeoxychorismate synthase component I [Leeia speluncae]MCB6184376.1 aminodeoxychorismate synthase component I [Leeia speluncae]
MREIHLIPLSSRPKLQSIMEKNEALFPVLLQSSKEDGWDLLLASTEFIPVLDSEHVLTTLNRYWQNVDSKDYTCLPKNAANIPFKGGWFVYCGYELLHDLEISVPKFNQATDFPAHAIYRTPAAIVTRRSDGASWLLVEPGFDALEKRLIELVAQSYEDVSTELDGVVAIAEEDPSIYLTNIEKVKHYIHEGDVFQVNLSRRWTANLTSAFAPHHLFAKLRAVNPAPFSGLVKIPQANSEAAWIISASPERLISVELKANDHHALPTRHAETRPIAGTHPRSKDPQEDEMLKQQLLASRKERAEHVMLVDLERNDLGRVCVPGTVKVDELMAVATYSYVHHIESNVHGELRADILPGDAIAAMFPGGTITGCPKVRTMQIIRELETHPRYAYTGSMGYVNLDGSMDMNILIRTFMYNPELAGEELVFRAGGGIVIDSDPVRELNETRAKVKGLMRALSPQEE